jgi:Tol biopolymer transport system component
MKARNFFRKEPGLSLFALLASLATALTAAPLSLVSLRNPDLPPPAGGNGDSGAPLMTPDGRYVFFASTAKNLAPIQTNMPPGPLIPTPFNVFLRDRTAATTTLVSLSLDGTAEANDDCVPEGISTNGRYLLFESAASNLVPGDTNDAGDIFVRDQSAGTTLLVSAAADGAPGNGPSRDASITPDGRFVVFVSAASNLVADDTNGIEDVFIRDLQAAKTTLVSVGGQNAGFPPSSSESAVVTPDGRYVAFYSTATGIVPGVPTLVNNTQYGDIYVRDVAGGTTVWASSGARTAVQQALGATDAFSFNAAISDDGQVVAYEASPNNSARGLALRFQVQSGTTEVIGTNAFVEPVDYADIHNLALTPDGRRMAFVANMNGTDGSTTSILLYDASTATTTLLSAGLDGTVATNSISDSPVLDPLGRFVVFLSDADNLVTNQITDDFHLFVRDLQAGATSLVDAGADTSGGPGVNPADTPGISDDGRLVVFSAYDSGLVPNDSNKAYDVFVRDTVSSTNELISARYAPLQSVTPDGASAVQGLSADGSRILFRSDADDVVANDTNGVTDIFIRDMTTQTTTLVSANTNGVAADAMAGEATISADGRFVAFSSGADDLVPGDANQSDDVFVRDLQTSTTTLASVNQTGVGPGGGDSYSPIITADGQGLLFLSLANDLAPVYSAPAGNLFFRDLKAGATYALTTRGVCAFEMTPDGHYVAFTEPITAMNLCLWDSQTHAGVLTNSGASSFYGVAISPDGNRLAWAQGDSLHLLDRAANTNWIFGSTLDPLNLSPQMDFSGDGRFLAYAAEFANSPAKEVYLYDLQTGTNTLVSQAFDGSGPADGDSRSIRISADGRFIAYRSEADNLVPGDDNGVPDIFLYDRLSGATTLISASRFGHFSAADRSLTPVFSADGKTLAFTSWASDLVPDDFNNWSDVFAFALPSSGTPPAFSLQATPAANPAQGIVISWAANPGTTYHVQFKNHLSDTEWQDLPVAVVVAGNRATVTDTTAAGAQRFYRVAAF